VFGSLSAINSTITSTLKQDSIWSRGCRLSRRREADEDPARSERLPAGIVQADVPSSRLQQSGVNRFTGHTLAPPKNPSKPMPGSCGAKLKLREAITDDNGRFTNQETRSARPEGHVGGTHPS
jgi:hypothetical protein